jgi:hypothetical protein
MGISRNTLVFLLLLLSLFPASPAWPTSIVIIRTGHEIIIGADSRQSSLDQSLPACTAQKIRQVGDIVVAASGIAGDDSLGFNVHRVVAEQVAAGVSMAEKIARVEAHLRAGLADLAAKARQYNPELYRTHISGKQLVSVVLSSFDKDVPLVIYRGFELEEKDDGSLEVSVIAHACPDECQDVFFYLFLGEREAIDRHLAATPGFWMGGMAAGVRKLVELEMRDKPLTVGPPLQLVRLTREGAQWLAGEGTTRQSFPKACP